MVNYSPSPTYRSVWFWHLLLGGLAGAFTGFAALMLFGVAHKVGAGDDSRLGVDVLTMFARLGGFVGAVLGASASFVLGTCLRSVHELPAARRMYPRIGSIGTGLIMLLWSSDLAPIGILVTVAGSVAVAHVVIRSLTNTALHELSIN